WCCHPCPMNTWSPIANMLSRRSSAGVAVLEGMLYVAGGNDGTSCLNSVERYNPKSNTWETLWSLRSGDLTLLCHKAQAHWGVGVCGWLSTLMP
uniref:Uncharacterized protein n=1 Tax=Zonotrichia albicollis TaxID=44394 RepID=A0A8D2MCE0_ZONAL